MKFEDVLGGCHVCSLFAARIPFLECHKLSPQKSHEKTRCILEVSLPKSNPLPLHWVGLARLLKKKACNHMCHEKNPYWLGYLGDAELPSYIGIFHKPI